MTIKMKSIAFKLLIVLTFNCIYLHAQKQKGNESFFVFINEFSNNRDFQTNRTVFPLECVSWDLEKDTTVTFFKNKNEWEYIKLFGDNFEGYTVVYDNFECELHDTDQRVLQWRGFTDMDIRFYFKRIKGEWFLVKYVNYDETF